MTRRLAILFCAASAVLLAGLHGAARAATYTVTSTSNSGAGSLRQALLDANSTGAVDTIQFNIPGLGPHVIDPSTALPAITDDGLFIDGSSQGSTVCGGATNGTGGLTSRKLRIVLYGGTHADDALTVSGASNVTIKGLTIGRSDKAGLFATGADGLTLLCNHFGASTDSSFNIGNAGDGARITDSDNIVIGDGTLAGANVFGYNGDEGLDLDSGGTPDAPVIKRNFFGVGADGATDIGNVSDGLNINGWTNVVIGDASGGGNVFSGNGHDGLVLAGGTTATVLGNFVGVNGVGTAQIRNDDDGIDLTGSGTSAVIGNGLSSGRNVVGGNADSGISLTSSPSATINGNLVGIGTGGQSLGNSRNVLVRSGSSAIVTANTIANGTNDGVDVRDTGTTAAIYANNIYGNGALGIDLDNNGVSGNDGSDIDTGPNDILNFPVINAFFADGTTDVSFDINLDVPSNANGYRVDFFRNTAADGTGYGEGEVHIGAVDVVHGGGDLGFSSSFTATTAVSSGDLISATATRKTSGVTYDITSEFSLAVAAVVSPLIVTSTADTNTLGTLRYAIHYANANAGADAITFNIAGAGPHTISLGNTLPWISDAGVSIDGTSQSGASCGDLWGGTPHTLMIRIDGPGGSYAGFNIDAASVTITGMSITGLAGAVRFRENASNSALQCSYIGLAPDGTPDGNTSVGVATNGSTSSLVGGLTAGQGNVISSNTHGVLSDNSISGFMVRGNFIGTDPSGTIARPNTTTSISHFSGTGTWSDITKNLIAGNSVTGIELRAGTVITGSSGDLTIAGNYIGMNRTGTAALANGSDGINFATGSTSGVTIGGTGASDRNIISGNANEGIEMAGVDTVTVLNNYIGLRPDGTTPAPNGGVGIYQGSVGNLVIGNGLASGRNVIAGNGQQAVVLAGTFDTVTIDGNYLGTTSSGNATVSNGINLPASSDEAISIVGAGTRQNITINSNVIGGFRDEAIMFWSGGTNTTVTIKGNSFGLGADGSASIANATSGTRTIMIGGGTSISGFAFGGTGAGNVIANSGGHGLQIASDVSAISGTVTGNTFRDNGGDAIEMQAGGPLAIYANSIHDNGGIGIDLYPDGVTVNDGGDGDAGANDLLNFPVINRFTADGSTSVGYDINLDVPSSANGYRIDFFRNTTADASGYGEGEVHLGSVDITHGGGDLTRTGTFTANAAVSVGNSITATATRKTGAMAYDITSEFSASVAAFTANPAQLAATKTVSVVDDGLVNGDDTAAIPGATLRYAITVRNDGTGAADADATVIVDQIPSNGAFRVADFDGLGGVGPVRVTDGAPSSGLSYSYVSLGSGADDLEFSDDSGASWTYAPSDMGDGADPNVTHIRVTPTGSFNANGGTPPTLLIRYDVLLF